MQPGSKLILALVFIAASSIVAAAAKMSVVAIPGGSKGVGLDDMIFAPALGRVIVPAGQTGNLMLIDPVSLNIRLIRHITTAPLAGKHFREGTTSVDYGNGYLFASDHDPAGIVVVAANNGKIVGRVGLDSGPDYVRYLAARHEVWVTEPRAKQIQVFRFSPSQQPVLKKVSTISVPGGPESLVFDPDRNRAYTNLWKNQTVVIDTSRHSVIAHWENSCEGSRGLALDAQHAHLFVACKEGKVAVLDLLHNGSVIHTAHAGNGIDIISYSGKLHRLYVPGARSETLTVFDVASTGVLKQRATYHTAAHAHCVADDGKGTAFVCDPRGGKILVFRTR